MHFTFNLTFNRPSPHQQNTACNNKFTGPRRAAAVGASAARPVCLMLDCGRPRGLPRAHRWWRLGQGHIYHGVRRPALSIAFTTVRCPSWTMVHSLSENEPLFAEQPRHIHVKATTPNTCKQQHKSQRVYMIQRSTASCRTVFTDEAAADRLKAVRIGNVSNYTAGQHKIMSSQLISQFISGRAAGTGASQRSRAGLTELSVARPEHA